MSGIELSSQGLLDLVSSFGDNFFPAIRNTVEGLAPEIVAVAVAVACLRLARKYLVDLDYWTSPRGNKIFGVERIGRARGRNMYWVPWAVRQEFHDEIDLSTFEEREPTYKDLKAKGVEEDDIPLSAFDYKERDRVKALS